MKIAKRLLDIIMAGILITLTSPILMIALLAIYLEDKSWPLYSPLRVGKNGTAFRMHKLRTMCIGADQNKVDTTGLHDKRITKVGHLLRRYKIDELPQFWNILIGDMSFVGPRPQIEREVLLYTDLEKGLLAVAPGITDLSSIVFSDLAEIVENASDPNIAYNQLVRPWKSRLGLFYVEHATLWLDLALIGLTSVAIISKPYALAGVVWILQKLNAPAELIEICKRKVPLVPTPPPGSETIVVTRNVLPS